jgi:hypothetical protein
MVEPSYPARFWEFFCAVIAYWTAWVMGVVLVIEQGVEFFCPNLFKRLDSRFPKERRRRWLLWLCAAGFAVASFQAFDDVNSRLRQATAGNQNIGVLFSHRWEPLSLEEGAKLEIALRPLPKQNVSVICISSDCMDLAYSFLDVFHRLHWEARPDLPILPPTDPIVLSSANQVSQKIIDAVALATGGRLLMNLDEKKREGGSFDDDINIFIGRKP